MTDCPLSLFVRINSRARWNSIYFNAFFSFFLLLYITMQYLVSISCSPVFIKFSNIFLWEGAEQARNITLRIAPCLQIDRYRSNRWNRNLILCESEYSLHQHRRACDCYSLERNLLLLHFVEFVKVSRCRFNHTHTHSEHTTHVLFHNRLDFYEILQLLQTRSTEKIIM